MVERVLSPKDWLSTHHVEIYTLLGAFYKVFLSALREGDPDENTRFFDQNARSYSEMPLCHGHFAISGKIELPRGYYPTTGHVNTSGEIMGERKQIYHQFLSTKQKEIIDFTASQFVRRGSKKGDRTTRLRELAPDLVTVFPDGFAALTGSIEGIKAKLGIEYRTVQLKPESS